MNKKKTFKSKKYFNSYDLGSWMNRINSKIEKSKFAETLGGLGGITSLASGIASGAGKLMNSNNNSTTVGNALQGIGSIASNIPGIGGLIGTGVQMLGNFTNAAFGSNIDDSAVESIEDAASRQAGFQSNASDNISLLSDFSNLRNLGTVDVDDVGSEGWFSNKATKEAERLTKLNEDANLKAWKSLQGTAENIEKQKNMNLLANFVAYGGDIESGRNGVTVVGAGGTHEENKYGGVPMGVDNEGIPNLVEEGEVIWNDYVFSNRLKVPQDFKKRHKIKGESFADAAKEIQRISSEMPDLISLNTMEANLNSLMNVQEMIRIKSNKSKSNRFNVGGKKGSAGIFDADESAFNYGDLLKFAQSGIEEVPDIEIPYIDTDIPFSKLDATPKYGTEVLKRSSVSPIKMSPLRYTPIIAGGISVLNDWLGGNDPDYSNADLYEEAINNAGRQIGYRPVGQYLDYTPFDTEFYTNRLGEIASSNRRNILNTSGGNRATAMAGILASDYNYGNQLGDLARKAAEFNMANKERVKGFNRQTDTINSELGLKVDMYNADSARQQAGMFGNLASMRENIARNKEAEHSSNLTNFIQGLADLGTEITDLDTLRWLSENNVLKAKGYKGANGGKFKKRRYTV